MRNCFVSRLQLDVCIKIIGCGGGGCNTINRCVDAGISGAQLCAINTDAKHLLTIRAPKKILIGKSKTRGLGAGARPEVGEESARENDSEIRDFLNGANIVFVTAGMGGGTGTGSAHYVAGIAKEQIRALTLGIVTLPFKAEGTVRMENALSGSEQAEAGLRHDHRGAERQAPGDGPEAAGRSGVQGRRRGPDADH